MASHSQRFWAKVQKRGPKHPGLGTRCWVWTAARLPAGYGLFKLNGRSRVAHSVAWEIEHGELLRGICVLHRCDNPACVRPDHLFLGTRGDNNTDRSIKGRSAKGDRSPSRLHPESRPRGSRHANAKLTEERAARIRELYAVGDTTQTRLARLFGVHQKVISGIVLGTSWKTS